MTSPPDSLVPTHTHTRPYRALFPDMNGDPHLIAVTALTGDGLGVWAAVAGDGGARYGWYTAPRTDPTAAILEAMHWALKSVPAHQSVRLATTSTAAISAATRLAQGLPPSNKTLHPATVKALAYQLRRRPIDLYLIDHTSTSPDHDAVALRGLAARLAWTALRFAKHGIAVDDPAAQRWLASDALRTCTSNASLRTAWQAPGHPGHQPEKPWTRDRRTGDMQWIPFDSTHGPYTLHLAGLDGDSACIATDASTDSGLGGTHRIGAWAAVRGDGAAWFGWYTAPRTNAVSAELEAVCQGLATYESGQEIHLIIDSTSAADVITSRTTVRSSRPRAVTRGVLHKKTLTRLTNKLLTRSVHIEQISEPRLRSSTNPLLGIADRLAWTALQFAREGIDPDSDQAAEWLNSSALRNASWRKSLLTSWRRWRQGFPLKPAAGAEPSPTGDAPT
ncbi:hypothetical protein ACFFMN_23145 [Planobispora siamensis]|uniref:hypothetical protein n=1 Tax=Planobispora siamensis TaxID=936338 RepID=UPI001950990A|nr:hypothetical protein [Planobispora siamensis]